MPETTDTIKAKLTPGEFVIRKEAVDMIGLPLLHKINNLPKQGGHSEIDKLMQMVSAENMKPMYGGGQVQMGYGNGGLAGYQPGGEVSEEAMYARVPDELKLSEGEWLVPEPKRMAYHGGEDSALSARNRRLIQDYGSIHNAFEKASAGDIDSGLIKIIESDYFKPFSQQRDEYLSGLQSGGLAGYETGGPVNVTLPTNDPNDYIVNQGPIVGKGDKWSKRSIFNLPTDDGSRYYLGEAKSDRRANLSMGAEKMKMLLDAYNTMQATPQDSIPSANVEGYFDEKGIRGLLGKFGFQTGGPVGRTERKTIRGSSPVEFSYDDPENLRVLMSVPASEVGGGDGLRYYLGEKKYGPLPNLDRSAAQLMARHKMAFAPQDSIPSDMIDGYFDKPSRLESAKDLFGKFLGRQTGGPVPDVPPVPRQEPNEIMQPGQPPAGSVMGPSDADIEQLRMMKAGRLEKSIKKSTIDKARSTLELLKLQGLINGEAIERAPEPFNPQPSPTFPIPPSGNYEGKGRMSFPMYREPVNKSMGQLIRGMI